MSDERRRDTHLTRTNVDQDDVITLSLSVEDLGEGFFETRSFIITKRCWLFRVKGASEYVRATSVSSFQRNLSGVILRPIGSNGSMWNGEKLLC